MRVAKANRRGGNLRKISTELRRFFEISRASAAEVGACIDLACAFGLLAIDRGASFKSSLSEISKII